MWTGVHLDFLHNQIDILFYAQGSFLEYVELYKTVNNQVLRETRPLFIENPFIAWLSNV